VAEELAVWLYGDRIATIDQERGRLRLVYSAEALERYPLGSPLLSLVLPLTSQRYTQGVVRPFLDGLLPEGDARRAIAEDFDLRANDTYGLIRLLGRDCAGAVVIQPAHDPPPVAPTTVSAERLTDAEVGELVTNLRSAPLGIGDRVRISLAGVQEKLLLTRMPDGGWGRPVDGTPSTHIVKPEIAAYPNTVENEAFCMRVAKHLGLPVAEVATSEFSGRKVLIVERYDRVVRSDGSVERLHQEDLCQATGATPTQKYEEDGGPSLRKVAEILQAVAVPNAVETLLRVVTLNVLIGNGDAHAKNYSLLHTRSGALALTPSYDLMSTHFYGDDHLAMYIDNVRRTSRVTAARIINEARRWGLSRQRAVEIISEVLDTISTAALAAQGETPGLPAEIPALIDTQRAQLGTTADADPPS
jgi:HipA N-terminal domain